MKVTPRLPRGFLSTLESYLHTIIKFLYGLLRTLKLHTICKSYTQFTIIETSAQQVSSTTAIGSVHILDLNVRTRSAGRTCYAAAILSHLLLATNDAINIKVKSIQFL